PEGHGRGRVELPRADRALRRPAVPDLVAVARPDGLEVAPVVAEVEDALREGGAALDRSGGVVGPPDAAGAPVQGENGPALGPEVDPSPVVDHGRGLAAAG